MRFAVRHETLYRYSVPVVLAPHVLRLTPRAEHQLRNRSLGVWPEPVHLHEESDTYGNRVARVKFSDQPTQELRIESRFELDTSPPGLASEVTERLPWTQLPTEDLGAYRPGDANADTLASWQGACRDYTVLFLEAARSLGMPGRFSSGYQAAADTPDGRRYLHAWPEVFLHRAGWRGWDPTHGVAAGEGHVALCAAPDQAGSMPVVGGFYFGGSSITSTLDFDLRITTS